VFQTQRHGREGAGSHAGKFDHMIAIFESSLKERRNPSSEDDHSHQLLTITILSLFLFSFYDFVLKKEKTKSFSP